MRGIVVGMGLVFGCNGGGGDDTSDDTGTQVNVTPTDGGTITSADGRVTLEVPPGAATEPVAIRITPAVAPVAAFPDGVAYAFGPDGLEFATPATLTFRFTPEEMDAADPHPEMAGEAGSDRLYQVLWVMDGGTGTDVAPDQLLDATGPGLTLTSDVTHFSEGFVQMGPDLEVVRTEDPLALDVGETRRVFHELRVYPAAPDFRITAFTLTASGGLVATSAITAPLTSTGEASLAFDLTCPAAPTSGVVTATIVGGWVNTRDGAPYDLSQYPWAQGGASYTLRVPDTVECLTP